MEEDCLNLGISSQFPVNLPTISYQIDFPLVEGEDSQLQTMSENAFLPSLKSYGSHPLQVHEKTQS